MADLFNLSCLKKSRQWIDVHMHLDLAGKAGQLSNDRCDRIDMGASDQALKAELVFDPRIAARNDWMDRVVFPQSLD